MNPEFWLERWQKNEISFHQQDINSHLQAFWPKLNPVAASTVFVPLCGKSRDMLWLRSQGHPMLGVEISPIAVNDFFTENSLPSIVSKQVHHKRWQADGLSVLEGDFFKLGRTDLQMVSHVFDRASLVAMPPDLRRDYARHLQSVPPDHANVLLVAFEYDQSLMGGPPFSVGEAEIRQLHTDVYAVALLHEQEVLDDYPSFRARGLQVLQEKVYCLQPV